MADINFKKFSKGTTITFTYRFTNEWKIRKWIAVRLLVMAARIMGVDNIEFVEDEDFIDGLSM